MKPKQRVPQMCDFCFKHDFDLLHTILPSKFNLNRCTETANKLTSVGANIPVTLITPHNTVGCVKMWSVALEYLTQW